MKQILVIDDDEGILDALSLILEEEGYSVDTTAKGEETYKKIQSFKPNLIILDVLMSGKDGREICVSLKNDKETKDIPIIMVSAHPTAREGAIQCGADEFLAKPFDTEELLATVAKYTK